MFDILDLLTQLTVMCSGRRESRSNLQHQTAVQGTNPLDRYGRRTRCTVCQSIYHWAKGCPTKSEHAKLTEDERQTEIEECNITLLSKDTLIFMVQSLGSAVIDTACTRSVCGEKWLGHYVSQLTQDELLKMKDIKSAIPFKFGDGRIVHSTKKVKITAVIAQTRCQIKTEVVPADIPLLLSKTSLKRAGAVLDIGNDKCHHVQATCET